MKGSVKTTVLALAMGATVSMTAVMPVSAGIFETLAGGAISMAYVSTALNKMDNSPEGQAESLAAAKERTGYLEDSAAQARVQRVMNNLVNTPLVKRSYVVYANPSEEFNAFATLGRVMSVNKGALDLLDDDQLAYVMAHEIAHGENKDIINGAKKQVGVATAAGLAGGGGSAILAGVAGNYLNNQVFTMSQEKKADELGFKILAESQYNLGGAPGSMAIIRNKYGDRYSEGLGQVINPNNHPKTSNRVKENIARMYAYSGNHVNVDESGAVFVNGDNIYTPAASGRYTGEERSYYMAGKLARLYHDNKVTPGSASYNGATVTVAGQSIITTPGSDVALMVATNLNNAFMKTAPNAKAVKKAANDKKTNNTDKEKKTKNTDKKS